jgi:hypothetical protein
MDEKTPEQQEQIKRFNRANLLEKIAEAMWDRLPTDVLREIVIILNRHYIQEQDKKNRE